MYSKEIENKEQVIITEIEKLKQEAWEARRQIIQGSIEIDKQIQREGIDKTKNKLEEYIKIRIIKESAEIDG